MGQPPCDAVQAEIQLDLLAAELATELPGHMRAFARAHAHGRPPPAAPLVARLASTMETALAACAFDELCDRAFAMLRLVAPLVIEDDARVAAARRGEHTWVGLARLAAARNAVAYARFKMSAVELYHRLNGCVGPVADPEPPGPPVAGWHAPGAEADDAAIFDAWQAVAARLGVVGDVRVDRAANDKIRPRTFVVEPKREVIVVVPRVIATPAAKFAVLHELGHAAAALTLPAGLPRVVDEGAAAYVARLAETANVLPARWVEPIAVGARARRVKIAAMLDRIERALPETAGGQGVVEAPPVALWDDPGAQAAYRAAEGVADMLQARLGRSPPRGQWASTLAAERDRVDRGVKL